MVAFVALLNLVGWGVLLFVVAPHGYTLGDTGVLGAGLGLTVFLLGARHAFDADHIAAIDNTTRMLVERNRPAVGVGFWFSLGHSSIVFGLAMLIALGIEAVASPVRDADSGLQHALGIFGPAVAGAFLLLVGTMNLTALLSVMRGGGQSEVQHGGLLTSLLRRPLNRVRKPRHMYPVGLLMGLGFDTATQVALLVLAAGSAAFALPWYAVLVLPVLFAAGMTLFDSVNGAVMAGAYRWAVMDAKRRAAYNIIVTGLSVVAAFALAILILLQLLVDELGLGDPAQWLAGLDTEYAGYGLAALLVATWLVCFVIARYGKFSPRPDGQHE